MIASSDARWRVISPHLPGNLTYPRINHRQTFIKKIYKQETWGANEDKKTEVIKNKLWPKLRRQPINIFPAVAKLIVRGKSR